tara:strand:- start:371 stop:730 length:360 start_codon:yes stop_codon:yes gene_type:complete
MLKLITKQFLYGRLFLWLKPRLSSIFFFLIIIFLIFYIHNEYLKYIAVKENSENNYIGLSFVIKNILIFIVAIAYFYFYSVLGKTKKSIEKSQENIRYELDRVDSLDYFLSEEEVNKKY